MWTDAIVCSGSGAVNIMPRPLLARMVSVPARFFLRRGHHTHPDTRQKKLCDPRHVLPKTIETKARHGPRTYDAHKRTIAARGGHRNRLSIYAEQARVGGLWHEDLSREKSDPARGEGGYFAGKMSWHTYIHVCLSLHCTPRACNRSNNALFPPSRGSSSANAVRVANVCVWMCPKRECNA